MEWIERLRAAEALDDLAKLLNFTPSGLSYVLYKLHPKYAAFDIPKRNGTTRHIKAPVPRLALAQKRLANLLYDCLDDLLKSTPQRRPLAHGFVRSRSIITNASLHKRRRYVLNLDLQEFFPSINFGRVRAVFMKDRNWSLNEKIATVISQIACDENELPQGSPCSPVISNLVTHILDVRLARLAKQHKCTYSRYADDITFSTGRKEFPVELAFQLPGGHQWQLGKPLRDTIERSGFQINDAKTRMQYRGSRQVTTGLTVNEKVNVRSEYYRAARAMCYRLFAEGSYSRPGDNTPITSFNPLEGVLQHIYRVRKHSDRRDEKEKKKSPTATRILYRRFLFFKNFVALSRPLIVPEGKTDAVYLKQAIRHSPTYQPRLGELQGGKFIYTTRYMNYSDTVHDVLQLGGGTGDLSFLINEYRKVPKSYTYRPMNWPVIIVVDNDKGAEPIFGAAKGLANLTISHAATDAFYYLGYNLYLVKTPSLVGKEQTRIEDFFDPTLLNVQIGGKPFDPDKKHGDHTKYGKHVFAEQVIKKDAATIDFSGFAPLLDRIVAVLDDYDKKLANAPPAQAAE